jgi:hypothetical protein
MSMMHPEHIPVLGQALSREIARAAKYDDGQVPPAQGGTAPAR